MAYVISSACIKCGSCAGECPVEAIEEGKNQYVINEGKCIECGVCTGFCSVDAISLP